MFLFGILSYVKRRRAIEVTRFGIDTPTLELRWGKPEGTGVRLWPET